VSAGTSTSPAVIRVLDACDATACVAAATSQVAWSNTDDRAREYLIAIGAQDEGVRGSFNVFPSLQTIAPNSRCDRATAVSAATPARMEMSNQSLATGPWCDAGATRYVRYYATTVPPGEVLHASALNPFSGFSYGMPELALREGCDATACLARSAVSVSRGSHLWWRNASAAPREVRVVAGWSSLSGNYYNLAVETFAPSPNGRCADAEPIALPLTRAVDLSRGDAAPTPCAAESRSPVSWYRARVEPGRALRVVVSAVATSPSPPVFVDIMDACDATACLASMGAARSVTATWRNEGAVARDVWIALRAGDNAPIPAATLTVDVM